MENFPVVLSIAWAMLLAACGHGDPSGNQTVPESVQVPASSSAHEVPAEEMLEVGGTTEGARDVCLIAKARPMRSQCLLLSLKGFEIGGELHQDARISVMACRPTERAVLDNTFLLGEYEARTGAYPGPRNDMARVTVRGLNAPEIFEADREGVIGTVSIAEVDDMDADVVKGEVIAETAEGSGVFLRRSFRAVFIGHYLNVSYWPNPDREWNFGDFP